MENNVNNNDEDNDNNNINNNNNVDTIENTKRKLRAMTELLSLTNVEIVLSDKNTITDVLCELVTNIGKKYNIHIWKGFYSLQCECNCLDYFYRKGVCKHIYWFGFYKFGEFHPDDWDYFSFCNFVSEHWVNQNNVVGRNNECCICLDEIYYDVEMSVCCINQCYNSVHTRCWKRFYNFTGNPTCVMCRSTMIPYIETIE